MPTKMVQKWYKKIIVGKNDYKNKIVGSLYQLCRQYNKLNDSVLDAICLQTTKNREFLQLFSPTANSDTSNNPYRPMEAEAINTTSNSTAQMKIKDLRKGRKTNYDDAKNRITKPPIRQQNL